MVRTELAWNILSNLATSWPSCSLRSSALEAIAAAAALVPWRREYG